MGSSKAPLRDLEGLYKGSIRGRTWRFMGSYKAPLRDLEGLL